MLIAVMYRGYCGRGHRRGWHSHSAGGRRAGTWACNSGVGKSCLPSHSSALTSPSTGSSATPITVVIVAIHRAEASWGKAAHDEDLLQNVPHFIVDVHGVTLIEQ